MNGWQAIAKQLQTMGVERVFGIPGTQNAELFSELGQTDIEIITSVHELACGFAAIGASFVTAKPSILLTISGPGFCFSMAALAEALHDSVPILNILIRNNTVVGRSFQLQDMNYPAIGNETAKKVVEVKESETLLSDLRDAWRFATEGEPGPVLLAVDVQILNSEQPRREIANADPVSVALDIDAVEKVHQTLSGKNVLLFAGAGASHASRELSALLRENDWTAITTTSGRGLIPEDDCRLIKVDQASADAVNTLIGEFDYVLAIGVKFSHNGCFGFNLQIPKEKLIHIDKSDRVLNANYPAGLSVCADAKDFAGHLQQMPHRPQNTIDESTRSQLRTRVENSKTDSEYDPEFPGVGDGSPRAFFAALQREAPEDALFIADSGRHQMLLRKHLCVRLPRQLLVPTNFQSMAFGLSAAVGCALAQPQRLVVCVHGDGGMQMCATDLLTAAKLGLRIVVFVLADGSYGLIKQQQLKSGLPKSGVDLPAFDLQALATATGVSYLDAGAVGEGCLKQLDQLSGPLLVRLPAVESAASKRLYSKARLRGRVRNLLGEKFIRNVKAIRGRK